MRPSDLAAFLLSMHARGASEFVLYHVGWAPGGTERLERVGPFSFDGDAAGAEQAAEEVIAAAEDDAGATGGTQTYGVWASHQGVDIGRKKWRVHARAESQSAGGELAPSEPANPTGWIAMVMRHAEASERTRAAEREAVLTHAYRMLKVQAEENADLRRESRKHAARALEVFAQIEELISARHARDLEASREAREKDAQQRMLAHLEPAVSMVVSKMLGMPTVPIEAVPTLDRFLESITPEQFEVIARTLSSEQMITLQGIYRERSEANKKREERNQEAQEGARPS
jgi:hypothetical protein